MNLHNYLDELDEKPFSLKSEEKQLAIIEISRNKRFFKREEKKVKRTKEQKKKAFNQQLAGLAALDRSELLKLKEFLK